MIRCACDLNRREFVRTMTAGLTLLPALGTEGLARILGPATSRVAVVKTADRKRGVAEALKLLDLKTVSGKKVVLKPNFNSADDAPGSTHNDTLAQLVSGTAQPRRAQRHPRRVERPAADRGRDGEEGHLRPGPRPAVRHRGLRADSPIRTG